MPPGGKATIEATPVGDSRAAAAGARDRHPEAAGELAAIHHAMGNQAVALFALADGAGALRTTSPRVQRKCAACEEEEEETVRLAPREAGAPASGDATDGSAGAGEAAASGAWVVGESEDAAPGQMRKDEFLAALREAVCSTADEGMAGTGQTTDGCPWLDHWFGQAEGRDAAYVEAALRKFAPETVRAAGARDAIAMVAARVRRSVDTWARTGSIADLPEGITPELPGGGILGAAAGVFFKARDGGARTPSDPSAIRRELGAGRTLDATSRSRMESAFGVSFAGVRLHIDTRAAALSDRLNARAFTVGRDVAFGAGEYRPGTLIGDALLAHELAHVVQQRAAGPSAAGDADERSLEGDANQAAAATVRALWMGFHTRGTRRAADAAPRRRSGLQLRRCSGSTPSPRTPASASAQLPNPPVSTERSTAPRARDATAAQIVAESQDTSVDMEQRAIRLVERIITQYYPNDRALVDSVRFEDEQGGLSVEAKPPADGNVRNTTGILTVRRTFVEQAATDFARRVLQVAHEIEHIKQWRAGLGGERNQDEREFLAFYHEGLGVEIAGTGRMGYRTRATLIDAALGYYNCLSADKQRQYERHRDQLLERRPGEFAASGHDPVEPPSSCQRQ